MAFLPSLGFLGFEIHIFYCNTPCLVWLPIQHRRKPISREPDFSVQKQGFLDGFLAAKVTCHVSLSYFTPAMRVDVMRDPGARQIQVVSGNFAWDASVPGGGFIPGTTATPAPAAVKDRLLQLWSTPHGALKAAERAASNAKVTKENGVTAITFPMTAPLAGITMKITLNASDHVEKVETRTENGTVTETTYSDYKDLGEIRSDVLFPLHITQKQGGVQVLDLTITKTDPNNPYVVFPVPESVEKPK